MSFIIGIGLEGVRWPHIGIDMTEPHIIMEDDGYYWFLWPYFERFLTETGEIINPYENAFLTDDQLPFLQNLLHEAAFQIQVQSEFWMVAVGIRFTPEREIVYEAVKRDVFRQLLYDWLQVIERAQALKKPMVCFGD